MKSASAAKTNQAKTEPAIEEIPLQTASVDIWDKKYRLKSMSGDPVDATIGDTFDRVAKALAEVEQEEVRGKWHEKFVWALQKLF